MSITPSDGGKSRPPRVGDQVLVLEGDEGRPFSYVPTGTVGKVVEVDDNWPHKDREGNLVNCSRVAWEGCPQAPGRFPGVWVDNPSLRILEEQPS